MQLAEPVLTETRRFCIWTGIAALVVMGVAQSPWADTLALVALSAIGCATALGALQIATNARATAIDCEAATKTDRTEWILAGTAIALLAAISIQTWFRWGTALAAGDTVLPGGTAWIGRVFDSWTWAGFDLGAPSQLPLLAPWASVLGAVQLLGGDPGLAQRLWYTVLYVGAGLAAFGLIGALRLGPVAAFAGAAVYLLSPYVVSEVDTNPIFLAAMFPLAAIPALLIAAGTGRLRMWLCATSVGLTAPFLGYVFSNPPLVGMILGATIATPLLVLLVEGKQAALKSAGALAIAVPLLLALSSYWIVPSIVHLQSFNAQSLATVSSWSWSETRATLRNALWLNDTWGWSYPEYYPYAGVYEQIPFSVLRFVLTAIAFGALIPATLAKRVQSLAYRDRSLRIATVGSTVALVLIFVSTGTRPPGNVLFNPLYGLPLGWLLREPGRFLMLASLVLALLVAVSLQNALGRRSLIGLITARRSRLTKSRSSAKLFTLGFTVSAETASGRRYWTGEIDLRRLSIPNWQIAVVPFALVVTILLGFPIYTGAEAPDSRPRLPPTHVQLPDYWTRMAAYADQLPMQGGILVLPPDDFYGMPYVWGYYGADGFIPDLFRRPVLVPNPQGAGYVTSPVLESAVNLTSDSILRHDWNEAQALVEAMNTPLVLVREDVDYRFESRPITNPVNLASALSSSPNFKLLRRDGLLDLFEVNTTVSDPQVADQYVTVDTQAPDLRALALFPAHTALVSADPQPGTSRMYQAPPLEGWDVSGQSLIWHPSIPSGLHYRVSDLASSTVVAVDRPGTYRLGQSSARVHYDPSSSRPLAVSVDGRSAITNGDFSDGPWPLADCRAFNPPSSTYMSADVVPDEGPGASSAIRLSARADSACINHEVNWTHGPLFISLMVNRVRGNVPRICLLEAQLDQTPSRCATLPPMPETNGWFTYRASVVPDANTAALWLYLYADAPDTSGSTIIEFASINALAVNDLPSVVAIADPLSEIAPATQLMVLHTTYTDKWHGPPGGKHVLADGMLNGWLIPPGGSVSATFEPTATYRVAGAVSVGTVALVVVLLATVAARRTRNRHRSAHPGNQRRV